MQDVRLRIQDKKFIPMSCILHLASYFKWGIIEKHAVLSGAGLHRKR
jgi:hypothetical protein